MTDYGVETIQRPSDEAKDPDEIQSYTFRWAKELSGETISTSTFLLPDGLTSAATSGSDSTRTIRVSGGTDGSQYRITNRITTSGSRTLEKTIRVQVRET
jgi:hypothetical protein